MNKIYMSPARREYEVARTYNWQLHEALMLYFA